jgi:CheY-like chemotaxis protein
MEPRKSRGSQRGVMPKSILVVDDQEDVRAMMKIAIENFGYSVIEAGGPFDAIEKAEEFHPHLILMDIGMPLLDGLSTAQMIGDIESCSDIPIVVLTAYSDIRDQADRAGCVDVLYKPVQFAKLKELLDSHLGH